MSKVKNGTLFYQLFQNNVKTSQSYKKWYAKAKHTDTVSFEELIDHMASHNIGFPRGVVQGVMMSFVDCLLELVAESKKVQLGDLGTFYLNINVQPSAVAYCNLSVKFLPFLYKTKMNISAKGN